MIKWMINAHPIQNRMAGRATPVVDPQNPPSGECCVAVIPPILAQWRRRSCSIANIAAAARVEAPILV